MDTKTFRAFAKGRTLQAIVAINQEQYPNVSVKMPPFCVLAFNENAIEISEVTPLGWKKKEPLMDVLPYSEVKKIEIHPLKKWTTVVFVPGTRFHLELKVFLIDGTCFVFECEEMGVISNLSEVLLAHGVLLVDSFGLSALFKQIHSSREGYDYLATHWEELSATHLTH